MNSATLNYRESAIVDAVLTLFQGMSQKMQKVLWTKLNSEMTKEKEGENMTDEEASKYLDSLVVKGGVPVPPEEDGMHAFIAEKYKL